jgi:hypothetical protein
LGWKGAAQLLIVFEERVGHEYLQTHNARKLVGFNQDWLNDKRPGNNAPGPFGCCSWVQAARPRRWRRRYPSEWNGSPPACLPFIGAATGGKSDDR